MCTRTAAYPLESTKSLLAKLATNDRVQGRGVDSEKDDR